MEDLQLKAWNNKFSTNVRISSRYKARFNSFIAVGALGAAFTLGSDPTAEPLANLTNFGLLLLTGVRLLIYPISVLTLLYYLYFRETVRENVKNRIDMPIAETKLIFRNFKGDYLDSEGNVLFDNSTIEEQDQMVIATAIVAEKKDAITSNVEKEQIIEDLEPSVNDEIKPLQKVGKSLSNTGKSVKRSIKILGTNVNDNTVGRLFKKRRAKNVEDKKANAKPKKKFKKGSATEDLWEHEENESGDQYKYQGGSATKRLWDKNDKES